MWRRSKNIRLIVEALHVLQETVVVLSNPEHGMTMHDSGTASRRVSSCKIRVARSRSEFAIVP